MKNRRLNFYMVILSLLVAASASAASSVETYSGEARADGHVVYIEKHTVTYGPDGQLLKAVTDYTKPDGKKLAHLESDFTSSLTVPDHYIENFVTGNVEGIRRDNGKLILFDHDRGKPERTKVIEDNSKDSRILVGCQGLNYYLLGNMAASIAKKQIPLRFLIPGKLDYYDFNLAFVKESSPNVYDFEVTIQNVFLRLFAPKLFVRYDGKAKHIINYNGLSNITDEKGRPLNVAITYTYNTSKN